MTSLVGASVITPVGRATTDIQISDGTIASKSATGAAIDLDGMVVAPGFIDTHVHGGIGHDFTEEPESIWEVGRWLPESGVTSFVPTLVASGYDTYDRAIDVMRAGPPDEYVGATPLGLHFEGPWLSPDWRGAHRATAIRPPDSSVASRWALSGVVAVVTMAPEVDGAANVAEILAERSISVSLGHTGATFDEAALALAGPWNSVTHLYNQMSGFGHRKPGVVGAALNSTAICELIADGLHSDPAALQLAWNVLGPERTVLVTDAMKATGLGNGRFTLGDAEVSVDETGPRLADGRLAGSVLTMDRAVANLVRWTSASLVEAVAAATITPARRLGLTDRGTIDDGQRADLVVLDAEGAVVMTMVSGSIVFRQDRPEPHA